MRGPGKAVNGGSQRGGRSGACPRPAIKTCLPPHIGSPLGDILEKITSLSTRFRRSRRLRMSALKAPGRRPRRRRRILASAFPSMSIESCFGAPKRRAPSELIPVKLCS